MLPMLLAGMSMLGPFSIDTYMPSFPAIRESLGATPLQMQQTLSVYLAAFAFMLLFHGALSDAFGRRPVVLAALGIFVVASLGCALSADLRILLVFRALQGVSAGAGMVVGRAIIRDRYHGPEAQRLMSHVTLIFGIAPAIAPIIGGWLQVHFGWRAVFAFLVVVGALLFASSARYLEESLPREARTPFHPVALVRGYVSVTTHREFLYLSGAVALNFSAFFLYIAAAPSFVIDILKLDETRFAWLFMPGIVGIMGGAWVSGRIAGRMPPLRCVRLGYLAMGAAAVINLVGNLSASSAAVPWAVLPIMVYTFGMSIAMPSITLMILDLFPARRGLAASLQGFVSSSANAVAAGALATVVGGSAIALAVGMASLLCGGFACWSAYAGAARRGGA
jgi:MFS transporter, DHA1 family, multidrug resistance protein